MAVSKKLTKQQTEIFIKENRHGILAMQGDTPYALPMGYLYKRRTILLGMSDGGRKATYINRNNSVCFTICKPRWEITDLKIPCTSVAVEGVLEEVTNRSYYGLPTNSPRRLKVYKIMVKQMGTWRCNRKPCELFAQKKAKKKTIKKA